MIEIHNSRSPSCHTTFKKRSNKEGGGVVGAGAGVERAQVGYSRQSTDKKLRLETEPQMRTVPTRAKHPPNTQSIKTKRTHGSGAERTTLCEKSSILNSAALLKSLSLSDGDCDP